MALKLKKLDDAVLLAKQQNSADKWKLIADLAFELGEISIAENAMQNGNDYNGLLLFYSW